MSAPAGPRIAIDALAIAVGGGVAWLRGLVPALAEVWPQATFDVLVRSKGAPPLEPAPRVRVVRLLAPRGAARMGAEWVAVPAWAAIAKPSALLVASDAGPVASPCPMVQVVQNAKVYTQRGARYRMLLAAAKATARASAATVFVSEAVRAVAEPLLEPRRGVVIRHGIEAPPRGPFPRPIEGPYVLVVATPYAHKDLATALDAVLALRARGRREALVLAGGGGDPAVVPGLKRRAAADPSALVLLGAVAPAALEAWYAHAAAVMLPSREESFGLPVAEALARGVPVVASDLPALVETGAGLALHHAVGDSKGAGSALERALLGGPVESALSYAEARTWREAARRYREVLSRP